MEKEQYYNWDIKKDFLENFLAGEEQYLKDNYLLLFSKTYEFEEKWNKDLYDFNDVEAMEFLRSLHSTSPSSIRNKLSIIKRYVGYNVNRANTNLGGFYSITSAQAIKGAVLNYNNLLFDRDDMKVFMKNDNIDDYEKLLLLGVFEGICGTAYSELRYMKVTDLYIDDNGKHRIKIYEDAEHNEFNRDIEISSTLYNLIIAANKMTRRYDPETLSFEKIRGRDVTFFKSDFVLKSHHKSTKGNPVGATYIPNIYRKMQDHLNLRTIKVKDIKSSGIGQALLDMDLPVDPSDFDAEVLTPEEWELIAHRFNISTYRGRAEREFEKKAFQDKFGKFKFRVNGIN